MPVKVIDASALGALVFGEPKAEEIAEEIADESMIAPALLWFELARICLRKMQSYPHQAGQILDAFRLAGHLPIEIVGVEHLEVVQMAQKTGLTTYDASYLWLAFQLNGELVALDKKLLEAARNPL